MDQTGTPPRTEDREQTKGTRTDKKCDNRRAPYPQSKSNMKLETTRFKKPG